VEVLPVPALPFDTVGNYLDRLAPVIPSEILNIVRATDTSLKVRDIYYRRLKGMTPSERLRVGVELWNAGHSLQLAAARRSIPGADEAEIVFRIAVTRFGSELSRKAYLEGNVSRGSL
jgi:hypothetical protein